MIQVSSEHEFEAAHGLPEALPAGEEILWQGAPDWKSLARSAFHVNKISVYFAVILALRAGAVIFDGGSAVHALQAALWLTPLAVLAIALLVMIAWFTARTAVYTITSKRVVMRIGVVLSVTFNLPFRMIEAAGLRAYADGTGDVPLKLAGEDHISYLHLWPHARPWRVTRTEPMLRAVPDVAKVGAILAQAIAAGTGGKALTPEAATIGERGREPENTGHGHELPTAA